MPWTEKIVANTRALVGGLESVTMMFGLGPAGPVGPRLDRMRSLLRALQPSVCSLRWGEQVHGRGLRAVTSGRHLPLCSLGDCDALITNQDGVGLAVWTADCVPVLIASDGVVAAVHSGWRGTALDVVGAVVTRLIEDHGAPPASLVAALGPAISGPRYQVGPEVIKGLRALGIDETRWRIDDCVDLRSLLAARLEALGVAPTAISIVGPCTASSPGLASFRRDGAAAGRQWSVVYRSEDT
jgi:YfiH family protein